MYNSVVRNLPLRHYGCTMDLAGGKRVGGFLLTDNDQPYMNETSSLVRVVGSDDLCTYSCQEKVWSNVDGG